MKVAINATFNPGGGAITQLVNIVRYFSSEDGRVKLVVYVTKRMLGLLKAEGLPLDQYDIVVCRIPGISVVMRIIWEQLVFPFLLIPKQIDVLFCPGNIAPLFSPGRRVQWIGTIGPFYKDFCRHFSVAERIKLFCNKHLMIGSALRANAVIFESHFTKDLFITRYGIKEEKAHVIQIGKDSFFYTDSGKASCSNPIIAKKSEAPFILCVSHLYPYKNIMRLLQAYSIALETSGIRVRLLIAGSRDYASYNKQIVDTIDQLSLRDSVCFLGSVEKRNLRYLYEKCLFLAFPSPFENFAYTLVEAMSCGVPIACSNTTAMPETCKNAALYFDPRDSLDMAKRFETLMTDGAVRLSLSEKARSRAEELPDYSEVTQKTLDIMSDLA